MFDRILVPLDGSKESESAAAEASRLAGASGQIFLLHVIPDVAPPAGGVAPHYLDLPEKAEQYLEGVLDRVPLLHAQVLVEQGDPAKRILKVALELNIDVIAMATHGRRGVSRLMLGSVAERVVRESWVPVLIAHAGAAAPERPLRRLLVPLDGSGTSERILEIVESLAMRARAEVALLHVTDEIHDPMGEMAPENPHFVTHDPRHVLQEIADRLEERGLIAWPEVAKGEPVEVILREARRLDADLIVMATHGRSGLERLLVGSVAEGVLRKADRPVILKRVVGSPRPVSA